ncbi:hypothetical protein PENARI_c018G02013 [Penicillium arizonense]|uniref:Uncharacterized protein n=1 Tax=Penicillium arizonense TaxID=1835702 RepID=A0A1F5LAS8_PENAI|nr:hypothetical protein PENARI_c018G02013 [Penicillium arizonense]OGE50100.1 hypothetical protein PENARI_c018G02013 [Penicillium arizonense]
MADHYDLIWSIHRADFRVHTFIQWAFLTFATPAN